MLALSSSIVWHVCKIIRYTGERCAAEEYAQYSAAVFMVHLCRYHSCISGGLAYYSKSGYKYRLRILPFRKCASFMVSGRLRSWEVGVFTSSTVREMGLQFHSQITNCVLWGSFLECNLISVLVFVCAPILDHRTCWKVLETIPSLSHYEQINYHSYVASPQFHNLADTQWCQ